MSADPRDAEQLRIDGTPEAPAKYWEGGYAKSPGTGPAGETCGTCASLRVKVSRSGRRFFKCAHVAPTSGRGTDIRKSAPACRLWESPVDTLTERAGESTTT